MTRVAVTVACAAAIIALVLTGPADNAYMAALSLPLLLVAAVWGGVRAERRADRTAAQLAALQERTTDTYQKHYEVCGCPPAVKITTMRSAA